MSPRDRSLTRWHLLLAVLIAHGSLYPFDFALPEFPGQAIRQMFTSIHLWTSRGDVLGNFLLFLPWGLASALTRAPEKNHLSAALGLALAGILQILQIGLPSRDAALSDIVWNAAGIYTGQFVLAPAAQRILAARTGYFKGGALPLVLAALWLAAQTAPCIPSLDFALLRANIRAFFAPEPWSLAAFIITFSGVLALGHIALTLLPARTIALTALTMLLPAVLCARLFIVQSAPHWHDAAAMLSGYAGMLALGDPRRIAPAAFAAMLLGLTLAGLEPYTLSGHTGGFGWLPFAAYLRGNMQDNLRELLEISWHCTALLWLAHAMGARIQGVGIFIIIWVLSLEIIQIWLEGRSADVTPALTCALLVPLIVRLARSKAPPPSMPKRARIRRAPKDSDESIPSPDYSKST
ncbi:MAG: hypothetical protein LBE06_09555 [Azoarcus sp.]|jgi:VanZ family protein|nr:hypothetical protein [Azoarcus sp.]